LRENGKKERFGRKGEDLYSRTKEGQVLPQKHRLAVRKPEQAGQQPDIYRQPHSFQFAGIYVRPPKNLLVFPVAVYELFMTPFMRVSINWYSAESFSMQSLLTWCRILPLKRGVGKRKRKKPGTLVAADIF